jgi:hypothetical protein
VPLEKPAAHVLVHGQRVPVVDRLAPAPRSILIIIIIIIIIGVIIIAEDSPMSS